MQAGRCPVIVSDEWLRPPFVDWDSCSIQIPEASVDDLPAILRSREGDAKRLGEEARRAWELYFAPERQLETLISACVALAENPAPRLSTLGRAVAHPQSARRGARRVKDVVGLGASALRTRRPSTQR